MGRHLNGGFRREVLESCRPAVGLSTVNRAAGNGPLAACQVLDETLAKAGIFDWHCHASNATQCFAETYVRRMEAMRRAVSVRRAQG